MKRKSFFAQHRSFEKGKNAREEAQKVHVLFFHYCKVHKEIVDHHHIDVGDLLNKPE